MTTTATAPAPWLPHHRHLEFLGFLRQIEKSGPEDLDVHLIVDNDCTHKHAQYRRSSPQRWDSATECRTRANNQIKAILVTAPSVLRERLESLTHRPLIESFAAPWPSQWPCSPGQTGTPHAGSPGSGR